jgi:hypothetical protein
MNMKPKQARLKVEFKRVQCLPDWPIIIRAGGAKRSLEDASAQTVGTAPLIRDETRLGARSLAE